MSYSPHIVEVIEITPHPESSKLKICKVSDQITQTTIVCGASNLKINMYTILAPVHSKLPSGLEIKEQSLRGINSNGMLCSAKDLGISKETGLIDLPKIFKLGEAFANIPIEYLSSVPWHTFKEVESFWLDPQNESVHILRPDQEFKPDVTWKLISKTYFDSSKYLYRNFQGAF